MKALHLTLLCHPLTEAQRTGCMPSAKDLLVSLPAPALEAWDLVLSAPEARAARLAGSKGDYRMVPALADWNLGRWAGVPIKRLQAEQASALDAWLNDPAFTGHGGESFEALRLRVRHWFSTLDSHSGRWLAVTHPWVIRAALGDVLQLSHRGCLAVDIRPLARTFLVRSDRWRVVFG